MVHSRIQLFKEGWSSASSHDCQVKSSLAKGHLKGVMVINQESILMVLSSISQMVWDTWMKGITQRTLTAYITVGSNMKGKSNSYVKADISKLPKEYQLNKAIESLNFFHWY